MPQCSYYYMAEEAKGLIKTGVENINVEYERGMAEIMSRSFDIPVERVLKQIRPELNTEEIMGIYYSPQIPKAQGAIT